MAFVEMDPDTIRELLKGHEDVLTKEAEEETERYKNLACPMCHEKRCEKRVRAPKIIFTPGGPEVVTPFGNDSILPQGYAHCTHCNTDFDPDSGLILSTEASLIHAPPSDPNPDPQRS